MKTLLLPPSGFHSPMLIAGDREFLEKLKKAIERALEEGITAFDTFTCDGEGHLLFIKLTETEKELEEIEDNPDKLELLESKWLERERHYAELAKLRVELLNNPSKSIAQNINDFRRFNELISSLFWDKNGRVRFPKPEEVKTLKRLIENELKKEERC